MKKKVLAVVVGMTMAMMTLTGCGAEKTAVAAEPAASSESVAAEETESGAAADAAADGMSADVQAIIDRGEIGRAHV